VPRRGAGRPPRASSPPRRARPRRRPGGPPRPRRTPRTPSQLRRLSGDVPLARASCQRRHHELVPDPSTSSNAQRDRRPNCRRHHHPCHQSATGPATTTACHRRRPPRRRCRRRRRPPTGRRPAAPGRLGTRARGRARARLPLRGDGLRRVGAAVGPPVRGCHGERRRPQVGLIEALDRCFPPVPHDQTGRSLRRDLRRCTSDPRSESAGRRREAGRPNDPVQRPGPASPTARAWRGPRHRTPVRRAATPRHLARTRPEHRTRLPSPARRRHPIGQIQAPDVMTRHGEEDGEAAGTAAEVDNGCRGRWHHGQQQVAPRRPDGGVQEAMVGPLIERRCLLVPEAAGLVGHSHILPGAAVLPAR
jgi:hypothetical protein